MARPTTWAFRRTGDVLWQRKSTLKNTTFAIGDGRVIGLDYVGTRIGGGGGQDKVRGPMFALEARTGEPFWFREVQYEPVPEHNVEHRRPWLLPADPLLAYNSKHKLTSRITGPIEAITRYGCGGANSDNVFTAIRADGVRPRFSF